MGDAGKPTDSRWSGDREDGSDLYDRLEHRAPDQVFDRRPQFTKLHDLRVPGRAKLTCVCHDPGIHRARELSGGQKKMTKLVALTLLLGLTGCTTTGRQLGGDPFSNSAGRPSSVRIEVRNLNFADARLYIVGGARRRSLGTVGGKQDASFTVSWDFNEDVRIEINLLAGPTCVTETLQVAPGEILELQIPSVFGQYSSCR